MRDKDELKQSLLENDIEKVLKYFNVDYAYNFKGDIVMETACHNEHGGSHKLYYYPESQTFHCFTNCSDSFDIYELVMRINQTRRNSMNFNEAYQTLASILGISIQKTQTRKVRLGNSHGAIKDWDFIDKLKRNVTREPKFTEVDENLLNFFPEWYTQAWLDEGITLDTQEKFGIKFNPEYNQTVIPHRDDEGKLVGVRVRNWRNIERGKYMPLYYKGEGYTHPLGYNLYGLHENKETIKEKKKVVIVEGEKSAMISHSMFGKDNFCVALCGSSMNAYQAELLMNLGVEEIIIAVDKDYLLEPDRDYLKKVKKIAKHFINKVSVYHITDTRGVLDYQDCMLDANKETVINIMKHDKHLITSLEDFEEWKLHR